MRLLAGLIAGYRGYSAFARSRKECQALAEKLITGLSGTVESRTTMFPLSDATSTHAPLPTLRRALRQSGWPVSRFSTATHPPPYDCYFSRLINLSSANPNSIGPLRLPGRDLNGD